MFTNGHIILTQRTQYEDKEERQATNHELIKRAKRRKSKEIGVILKSEKTQRTEHAMIDDDDLILDAQAINCGISVVSCMSQRFLCHTKYIQLLWSSMFDDVVQVSSRKIK
eukprot:793321_1